MVTEDYVTSLNAILTNHRCVVNQNVQNVHRFFSLKTDYMSRITVHSSSSKCSNKTAE